MNNTKSHLREFEDILRLVIGDCIEGEIVAANLIGLTVMTYCHDQHSEAEYGGMALFKVAAVLHNAHKLMFLSADGIYLEYVFDERGWFFAVNGFRFRADKPVFGR